MRISLYNKTDSIVSQSYIMIRSCNIVDLGGDISTKVSFESLKLEQLPLPFYLRPCLIRKNQLLHAWLLPSTQNPHLRQCDERSRAILQILFNVYICACIKMYLQVMILAEFLLSKFLVQVHQTQIFWKKYIEISR